MKKKLEYLTQKNPNKPTENEVIEVTKIVIETDADSIIHKKKLNRPVLKKQLKMMNNAIKKMEKKRDDIQHSLDMEKKYRKSEPTISLDSKDNEKK